MEKGKIKYSCIYFMGKKTELFYSIGKIKTYYKNGQLKMKLIG